MAEPAWVLRARRARVRRARSHDTLLFWSLHALARRFGSFLPAWLILLLRRRLLGLLPLIDARPTLRAADTARAVLNGLSTRDTQVWQRRLTQRRQSAASPVRPASL